jgi:putative peptidoglycan lipid II flippase
MQVVSLLALLPSVISIANQVVIAAQIGASIEYDIFLLGTGLALACIGIAGGMINHAILSALSLCDTPAQSGKLAVALVLSSLGIVVAVAIFMCAGIGLNQESLTEGHLSSLSKVSLIAVVTFALAIPTQIVSALLTSQRRIISPVLAACAPYLGMTIAVIASEECDSVSLALGLCYGYVAAAALLLVSAWTLISWPDRRAFERTAKMASSILLLLIGFSAFSCFAYIDPLISIAAGEGAVSTLGYAQRVLVGLASLVVSGPALVLIPLLATLIRRGHSRLFLSASRRSIRITILNCLVIVTPLCLVSEEFVWTVFGRGAFASDDVVRLSGVLPTMLIGMVGMVGVVIAFKVFIVSGRSMTCCLVGLAITSVYAVSGGALSNHFGLKGIGVAYCLSWWTGLLACLGIMAHQSGTSMLKMFPVSRRGFVLVVVLLVAALLLRMVPVSMLPDAAGLRLGLAAGVAGVTVLAVVLGGFSPPELSWLRHIVRRRLQLNGC